LKPHQSSHWLNPHIANQKRCVEIHGDAKTFLGR
jgi:hypothetical protein